MANSASDLPQLRSYIHQGDDIRATELVRTHPRESEAVLQDLSRSDDTDVRRNVAELAGTAPTPSNCRLLLRGISDADLEIRDLSTAFIARCTHAELAPEVSAALERESDTAALSALALLLGQIGDQEHISTLRRVRKEHDDDVVVDHDVAIAMARLGDTEALGELRGRLRAETAPEERVQALNDAIYVDDRSLLPDFGPSLSDRRDVIALSIPENPPMEYARVADVAAYSMGQMGVQLPYQLEQLERLSDEQLQAAERIAQGTR